MRQITDPFIYRREEGQKKTEAAVAFESGKPLQIVEVDLEGPQESVVLVEVKATGICHTVEFTLSGADRRVSYQLFSVMGVQVSLWMSAGA